MQFKSSIYFDSPIKIEFLASQHNVASFIAQEAEKMADRKSNKLETIKGETLARNDETTTPQLENQSHKNKNSVNVKNSYQSDRTGSYAMRRTI